MHLTHLLAICVVLALALTNSVTVRAAPAPGPDGNMAEIEAAAKEARYQDAIANDPNARHRGDGLIDAAAFAAGVYGGNAVWKKLDKNRKYQRFLRNTVPRSDAAAVFKDAGVGATLIGGGGVGGVAAARKILRSVRAHKIAKRRAEEAEASDE